MNNEQKIRRALRRLLEWTEAHTGIYAIRVSPRKDNPDKVRKEKELALAYARKALALSPCKRNCDVGSEEEQSRRYEAFCEAHHMQCDKGCSACPCSKRSGVSCELYWAQMPYVEKEGGNNAD